MISTLDSPWFQMISLPCKKWYHGLNLSILHFYRISSFWKYKWSLTAEYFFQKSFFWWYILQVPDIRYHFKTLLRIYDTTLFYTYIFCWWKLMLKLMKNINVFWYFASLSLVGGENLWYCSPHRKLYFYIFSNNKGPSQNRICDF